VATGGDRVETMTVVGFPGRPILQANLVVAIALLALSTLPAIASAHGSLASGEGHDDPTAGELLLTPVVVGLIHLVAMVALFAMAYRAREQEGRGVLGDVPEEARQVFGQFIGDKDTLRHAFRPNRRMFIVSKNLPHFFVLTGLAVFFSVYTYKWLGSNTVYIYTAVHGTAIVLLFAHSALAWRNTWYGISSKALYSSFGSLSTLAISMPLEELGGVEVRGSRLKGLLDVSSLKVSFEKGSEGGGRVDVTMRAVDAPDRIKEVILHEANRLRATS
jgi:hypothetical protein